jgi:general secretion pathway protein C
MRSITLDREHLPQTIVVALVTVAALALLALVAAYWTWVWLAPRPAPLVPPASTTSGAASGAALFGNVQQEGGAVAPTGIAIRLLGIVAAKGGHSGYAVVELEPKQILAVQEGEDVTPGIRLAEVGTDHILLERNGTRETLTWPDKNKPAEPAPLRPMNR